MRPPYFERGWKYDGANFEAINPERRSCVLMRSYRARLRCVVYSHRNLNSGTNLYLQDESMKNWRTQQRFQDIWENLYPFIEYPSNQHPCIDLKQKSDIREKYPEFYVSPRSCECPKYYYYSSRENRPFWSDTARPYSFHFIKINRWEKFPSIPTMGFT